MDAEAISYERFDRLSAVDARKCRILADMRKHRNGEHSDEHDTSRVERGLVALASMRCASLCPPPASLPEDVHPMVRENATETNVGTQLLRNSARRQLDNCWTTFGDLAETYVRTRAKDAHQEIKALKEQRKKDRLGKDDRRCLKDLKTFRQRMRRFSIILKEPSPPPNPEEVPLSARDQERQDVLDRILAEKAKARQEKERFDGEKAPLPAPAASVRSLKRKKRQPSLRNAKRMRNDSWSVTSLSFAHSKFFFLSLSFSSWRRLCFLSLSSFSIFVLCQCFGSM